MDRYAFLRGQDVFIEVEGKKVAAAQSYRVKTSRPGRAVRSYFENEAAALVPGGLEHEIELERLSILELTDFVDFYDLSGFTVVIKKPDCTVCFYDCEWTEITEGAAVNKGVIEKVILVSRKREKIE